MTNTPTNTSEENYTEHETRNLIDETEWRNRREKIIMIIIIIIIIIIRRRRVREVGSV